MNSEETSSVELVLEHSTVAPGKARRAVQDLLGDDAPILFIRDAILMTSELVTNAMQHTTNGCSMLASFDRLRQHLRVEVADSSPSMPVMRDPPTRAQTGGQGLRIVNEIATAWGAVPRSDGKTTWFELNRI
ncbi:MAG: phosphatase [Ilumatobacteraceae bacterium]|nr:phosphatase [Ilumatobacteraceae bacterium]